MINKLFRKIAFLIMIVLLVVCVGACSSAPAEDEESAEAIVTDKTQDDESLDDKNPKPNNNQSNQNNEQKQPEKEEQKQPEKEEEKQPEKEEEKQPEKEEEKQPEKEEEKQPEKEEPDDDQGYISMETVDYSTYIKVATYNIMRAEMGKQLSDIIKELRVVKPEIIGLQEVEYNTLRSGSVDQAKRIASGLGYKYYYFARTVRVDDDGGYGHAVVSKYPITKSENIFFEAQGEEERRSFERHEIDINGRTLVFYNTHLGFGTVNDMQGFDNIQAVQMKEIMNYMERDKYSVCTGDFNNTPSNLAMAIDTNKFVLLNGGDGHGKVNYTFPAGAASRSAIDNIIVSRSLKYYWDGAAGYGILVNISDLSDHNMAYSYIQFDDVE